MAIRRALLMVLTIAVFLPACTVLQTLGRSRAEAELSPSKVVAPVPTPVPASPVIVTPPARPQKVEAEQDAEDPEEVEDAEDTEGAASSQEAVPQPVPLPSTGMMEGAPVPLAGARHGGGVPAQPGAPQYVSLNFDNADLELVLRSIADITGINFIIGPGVKANVTMRTTTRVPAGEVFSIMESVLGVNNLAAVKEGSYYKIVPIAVAQQEPEDVQVGKERTEERERYVTQIVHLDHLSADEMTKILQPFLSKGAKMLVHKETNSLIIAGFSSTISRLLDTVKALDIPSKRDNIQRIFVYFVENAKASELANTLNTLYGRRDLVRGAVAAARPGQPPARPGTPPAPSP
ncbi:secretin N-terminal domain-containing protein, partial [Candidatus Methylomirabilis sp.]|uniref:secretin N-terminal domain-containing protein n=1 Tax=Candidatus Methylomirabilis sp. TaxID=2032687 RepID=UPI003C766A96